MDDETRTWIVLSIQSQGSRGVCGGIITIDTRRQRFAAKISSAEVIGGWRSQAGKVVVSGREVGMSCRRRGITGLECAVCDNARRESGNGSARTYSNASRNVTKARVSHGGSAQDGETLGRSEGLRVSLSCESCQCDEGEEKSRDEPKAK